MVICTPDEVAAFGVVDGAVTLDMLVDAGVSTREENVDGCVVSTVISVCWPRLTVVAAPKSVLVNVSRVVNAGTTVICPDLTTVDAGATLVLTQVTMMAEAADADTGPA